MGKGLLVFALLVTGGLTLLLGRPANSKRRLPRLQPAVVSSEEAEVVVAVDTLRRGEVLAKVLSRQSLTATEVANAVDALRAYANPRTLRPGVTLQVQHTAWDSLIDVTLRIDPDHEVRLAPGEFGWSSELKVLAVRVDTLVLAGSVSTTLYHSVMALPAPRISAQERIERLMWGIYRPFQWSIDFGIDLRPGDHYRVVYERHVRDNGSVRHTRVLAAEFTNRGVTHRAFWFGPRREYFDADGKSMKRVFLKAPVDFRRISSRFAWRRYHPALGIYRAHLGTDYAADIGTSVNSTADGTVSRAGWWGGYGRIVEIRHVNGYATRYAHLGFIAKGIRRGVRVRQGQLIGHVGQSGLATGPHLHYELLHNGAAIDQRSVDLPSGEPVAAARMREFQRVRDRVMRLLERGTPEDVRLAE